MSKETKTKTRELMAKNVPLGSTVEVAGGLGTIEVASKTTTAQGNIRLAEPAERRGGNRRKRRYVRRQAIFHPQTRVQVTG